MREGKQQQLPSRINVTWSVILLWYAQTRVVLTAAASSASARECTLFSLPSWRWGGWFHWNCSSCKSSVVYQSQTLWLSCTLASETSPSLKTNKQDKTVACRTEAILETELCKHFHLQVPATKVVVDHFYIVLFSALKQTHSISIWFYTSE